MVYGKVFMGSILLMMQAKPVRIAEMFIVYRISWSIQTSERSNLMVLLVEVG